MKSISIIFTLIFFTSNLFAQIDTIYTKKGNIYACTIIELDDEKIQTIDATGSKLGVYLFLVESVNFDSIGEIYNLNDGYTVDIETLEPALEWRLEQIEKEKELEEESVENEIAEKKSNSTNAPKDFIKRDEGKPKFSFGIFYMPNLIGTRYFYYDSYYRRYTVIEQSSSIIESQFSYNLHHRLFLTTNISYTSASVKNKSTSQVTYNNPANTNDSGTESEYGLKQFTFEFGIKYYFKEFFSNKVSAYALAGIGKTFAWAKDESKVLFQEPDPNYTYTNNRNEYLEDSNSPFLFQVGFGTEYFFNESLSVYSSLRFYYSATSAEYRETITDPYTKRSSTQSDENSDLVTRVGFGLNFYF